MGMQPKAGGLTILTALFALSAFLLMWIGSVGCDFIQFTSSTPGAEISRGFGIWSYQYWSTVTSTDGTYLFKSCHKYPDMTLDASWKAARAFCVLAMMFGTVVIVIKSIVAFCSDPEGTSAGGRVAPLYLITAIFQGLTLLFLGSKVCTNNVLLQEGTVLEFPDTCGLARGANCIISATAFWFCAAVSDFMAQKALQDEKMAGEPVDLTEPLAP